MPNLPIQSVKRYSDKDVTKFLDNFFIKELSYPANQVESVISFFKKRGFSDTAAISTATTLLQQARRDNVEVYKLLDTLEGITDVQLSRIVAEILNYNRPRSSSLGYKTIITPQTLETRNIIP